MSADSGDITSVGGEHVTADGGFDFTNIKRIPRSFFTQLRGGQIAQLDILVVKDGATTGKVALVDEDFPFDEAAVNEHVFCARIDQQAASPRYIYQYLRSPQGQSGVLSDFRGATVGGISREFASKTLVPLPPLREQERIADILDRVDALRGERQSALELLHRAPQAVFLEQFGDPVANDRAWPLAKIGDIATDHRGGANLAPADFVDSGYPILHKGALKPGGVVVLDTHKKTFTREAYAVARPRSRVDRSFVAVTLRDLVPTGPTIGLAVNLENGPFDRYLLAQGVVAFRLDMKRVTPEYFVQVSNMPAFRQRLRQLWVGSTQIHIRNPIYFEIAIPVPLIEQQREFDRRTAQIRAIGKIEAEAALQSDALFASLQHRAFRGEL